MLVIASQNIHVAKEESCHVCKKNIKLNEKVYLFACHHLSHRECFDQLPAQKKNHECLKTILYSVLYPLTERKFYTHSFLVGSVAYAVKVMTNRTNLFLYTITQNCSQQGSIVTCNLSGRAHLDTETIICEYAKNILGVATGIYIVELLKDIYNLRANNVQKTPYVNAEVQTSTSMGYITNYFLVKITNT